MPLGICTRYQNHEATYAAIRFAAWAAERGSESSLFPTTQHRPRINRRWDAVAASQYGRRFTDWAKEQTTIIWTHIPPVEQINWTKKQGIHTVLFALWHELLPCDREVVCTFDSVIAPSRAMADLFRRWGVKKSRALPWDTGLPFTAKDPRLRLNHQWLLLPLFDSEPDKTEVTALEVAGRALFRHHSTVLSVMYNSSTIGGYAKRRLMKYRRMFGDRIRLMPSVPPWRRPLVFRCHDLTIWPTQRENTGMVGLTSITMGTPVIAFLSSPLDEILTKSNSVPIPVEDAVKASYVTLPEVDYDSFERALDTVLVNDDYLRDLQQSVLYGLPQRRNDFNTTLASEYLE